MNFKKIENNFPNIKINWKFIDIKIQSFTIDISLFSLVTSNDAKRKLYLGSINKLVVLLSKEVILTTHTSSKMHYVQVYNKATRTVNSVVLKKEKVKIVASDLHLVI